MNKDKRTTETPDGIAAQDQVEARLGAPEPVTVDNFVRAETDLIRKNQAIKNCLSIA